MYVWFLLGHGREEGSDEERSFSLAEEMLAAAFIDSAAVVPTVTYRSHPVVT